MLRLAVLAIASCALFAQNPNEPRGHWTGDIETPNGPITFAFDLDKTETGWIGSMAVPAQNVSGILLAGIRVENGVWKFSVTGGAGAPTFAGKLTKEGKLLDGQFSQNGSSTSLKLAYQGEPKVELPKKSRAVPAEFVGEWVGALEEAGLRLVLKIANFDGVAKAMLVSVDQGGVEIPATSIEVKDKKIIIEIRAVDGGYSATLSGEELRGEWSQRGRALPLTLKKR